MPSDRTETTVKAACECVARRLRPCQDVGQSRRARATVHRESDGTTRQGKTVVAGLDWHREIANEELTWVRIDHQTRLQFARSRW